MTIVDARADPKDPKGGGGEKPKRRWGKPAAIAIGAFLLMLAPFWVPTFLRPLDFFRLRHVEVVGARYAEPRDILDRMNVDTLASVWDATPRLEARVRTHPLVREARVRRKLPGTLVVQLVEHTPIALVSTTGGFKAYDERGVALPIDPANADVDAPILSRPDSVLLRLLAAARVSQPALYRRLSEVRRERDGGGGNELVFVLDSIPVRTPGDITLNRLADVELVEQDLARRRLRAAEIDLRYRDQVIARLK
jgi:cell division protein FtsQ